MIIKIDLKKHSQFFLQTINGAFKEGDILPAVRNLAFELKVNPNTVQKAYKELERDGWIEIQRGEGYFVKKPRFESLEKFKFQNRGRRSCITFGKKW